MDHKKIKTKNMSDLALRTAVATAIGLIVFGIFGLNTSVAKASSFKVKLDLTEILEKNNLKISDVNNGVGLIPRKSETTNWKNGIKGPIKKSFFTLSTSKNGGRQIAHALKVSYNGINLDSFTFEECTTLGQCKSLSSTFDRKLQLTYVTMDETDWVVRAPGSPCNEGLVCSFTLSSWSLEHRRTHDGNFQPFPEVVTIVDLKSRLSIINSVSNQEWLGFAKGADAVLTDMNHIDKVDLTPEGKLVLYYGTKVLILDFANDKAFVAGQSDFRTSNDFLGGLGQSSFTESYADPSNNVTNDQIMLVTDKLILWNNKYVGFFPKSTDPSLVSLFLGTTPETVLIVGTEIDSMLHLVRTVSLSGKEITVREYDSDKSEFIESSTYTHSSMVNSSNLSFSGRDLILISDKDAKYITGNNKDKVFFTLGLNSNFKILEDSSSLIMANASTDQKCTWKHQYNHPSDITKKYPSNLSGKCGKTPVFSFVGNHISIVEISGSTVVSRYISSIPGQ